MSGTKYKPSVKAGILIKSDERKGSESQRRERKGLKMLNNINKSDSKMDRKRAVVTCFVKIHSAQREKKRKTKKSTMGTPWGGHIGCIHLFFFHFGAVLRWHINENLDEFSRGGRQEVRYGIA